VENDSQENAKPAHDPAENGRRQALLKIGKYGAYVAPAVLALVLGKRAEAVCSCA
jgi:hypothetical protein